MPGSTGVACYCMAQLVLHGMDQQAGCSTMTMLEGFVFQLLTEKHVMKMASNLRPIVKIICGGCEEVEGHILMPALFCSKASSYTSKNRTWHLVGGWDAKTQSTVTASCSCQKSRCTEWTSIASPSPDAQDQCTMRLSPCKGVN